MWGRAKPAFVELVSGLARARTTGLAAEMAFYLFLAVVPLAAVAGFAAARLATGNPWLTTSALGAVPPQVRDLLAAQLERVAAWHGGAVAPLAIATFLWLASSGVQAVFDALEVQEHAERRPWWKKRLLAIATCIVLSLGVAVLALLGTGLEWIGTLAGRLPAWAMAASGPVAHGVRLALGFVVAVAMLCGVYRIGVPRAQRSGMPTLPGAVVAVVLMALLGWGYGLYLARLGGNSDVYKAGLAAIGFTMTTIWLLSIALLVGAQLNCVVATRLRGHGPWQCSAASSSPATSRRRPAEPSTGPSSSPPASARP